MHKLLVALACAAALSACSGESADAPPPLAIIEQAALDYAGFVDQAAGKLAQAPRRAADLARRAVASCRELRAKALALKGVPVMFPTIAEFDASHLDAARHRIDSARGKNDPDWPR